MTSAPMTPEPMTSASMTSEPKTSEPMTSEPMTSEPVVQYNIEHPLLDVSRNVSDLSEEVELSFVEA